MKTFLKLNRALIVSAFALFCSAAIAQENAFEAGSSETKAPAEIRLKFIDGSTIGVDEAWESEQGIWYRRGGMSHLVGRERVKSIDRGAAPKTKPEAKLARVKVTDNPDNNFGGRPVWIYLIGGARVEADNAMESSAGVWYRAR